MVTEVTSAQVLLAFLSPSLHGYFNVSSLWEGAGRAGRDLEILSSAFCCPKLESTCSKICLGAAQHRMGSAALTSTACPTPSRPCWTPPLQCRAFLLVGNCSCLLSLHCAALLGNTAMPEPSLFAVAALQS